ncbi:hypothetical protein GmHk_18G053324 [Glycine max]|nr:hypothetical protein GmHk_18G053324 [Glycine max]
MLRIETAMVQVQVQAQVGDDSLDNILKSLQVWAHIRDLAPFRRRFTSLQRITDFLIRGKSTSGVQGKLRCLAIASTVYCIWLSRNKLIFEDYQFSVIEVISKIKFLMY